MEPAGETRRAEERGEQVVEEAGARRRRRGSETNRRQTHRAVHVAVDLGSVSTVPSQSLGTHNLADALLGCLVFATELALKLLLLERAHLLRVGLCCHSAL